MQKLNRFYRRKSQRKCKLSRQNAYEKLVRYYGLYDLYAGSVDEHVKAWKELCRKAVCGKTACTV